VISSPKDRREQEGYQNSGSFGENGWGYLGLGAWIASTVLQTALFTANTGS